MSSYVWTVMNGTEDALPDGHSITLNTATLTIAADTFTAA